MGAESGAKTRPNVGYGSGDGDERIEEGAGNMSDWGTPQKLAETENPRLCVASTVIEG